MAEQLTIFETGVKCEHCKKDPGVAKANIWNGFYDADLRVTVCWACKYLHYGKKMLGEHKNKFSEMPVIIANDGNNFPFKTRTNGKA